MAFSTRTPRNSDLSWPRSFAVATNEARLPGRSTTALAVDGSTLHLEDTMNVKGTLAQIVLGIALVLMVVTAAHAQATRTWVSGVGDDVNPCSRTAPCKTWSGAISKTAANGIIDALDPGGFGVVTITKSITIEGQGTLASVLGSGTNGIIIDGTGISVTLRNLDIEGARSEEK